MIEAVRIPVFVTLAIDPATTDESWSNATGITINGESDNGTWYGLKADPFHGQPSEVLDRVVYYAIRYKPKIVSCEIIAAQRLYIPMLREAFDKYGIVASILPYKYSTRISKRARIESLQPKFKQKKVFFKRGECEELIRQLTRYPETGDEDDLIDAYAQHLDFSRPIRPYESSLLIDTDELMDEDEVSTHRTNGTWVGKHGSRYAA